MSARIHLSRCAVRGSRFAMLALLALACSIDGPRTASRHPRAANKDSPDAAARYFAMKRGLTSGINPYPLYDAARAQMERRSRVVENAAGSSAYAGTWSLLGPMNV